MVWRRLLTSNNYSLRFPWALSVGTKQALRTVPDSLDIFIGQAQEKLADTSYAAQ